MKSRLPAPMPYGDMRASKSSRFRRVRPEDDGSIAGEASARVSGLKLAATDETNLSTPQSATQTDTRLSRPDGHARGAQRAQTPSRQGPQTAGYSDTAEAARLTGERLEPRSTYTATDRLHRRAEFLRVQQIGARAQTDHFVVYAARFPHTKTVRLGTAISRRLGNAVIRNQLRRRVRECFRLGLRLRFCVGTSVVVIGRAGVGALPTKAVMRELDDAATNLRFRLDQNHE
jgi:ribonuclease P protein component